MPDISRIRSLSPAALRIFKEQAQQKARNGDPNYSRLVSMPELADIFGGSLSTKPKPNALATAVDYATTPLRWIDENVTKPFGAIATSPFTPDVPGTKGMNWLEKERAQYEQWKEPEFTMPWGGKFRPTKGVVESLPWLAVPSAGGVVGKLGGLAAKGGKIGTIAKAGQAALKPLAAAEALPGKIIDNVLELNKEEILAPIYRKMGELFEDLLEYQKPGKKDYHGLLQKLGEQFDANKGLKTFIVKTLKDNGLPDEFVVFHGGGKGSLGKYTNVTLDDFNAQVFAELKGTTGITSYKVKLSDVIGIGDASVNELIVKSSGLKPLAAAEALPGKVVNKLLKHDSSLVKQLRNAFVTAKPGDEVLAILPDGTLLASRAGRGVGAFQHLADDLPPVNKWLDEGVIRIAPEVEDKLSVEIRGAITKTQLNSLNLTMKGKKHVYVDFTDKSGKVLRSIEGSPAIIRNSFDIPETAIIKLTGVVRQAEKVLPEQKLLTHQERKIRLGKAMKALDEGQGEAAYVSYMKELKGNIPDVSFKPIGNQLVKEEWDELANVMKSNPLIKGYEHATGNKALQKLKEGVLPVQSELDVLEKAFGPELVSELIKKAPPDRWAQAMDIANAPRAVLSSFDMSGILRQGAVLSARRPIEALKTVKPMIKAFFSDKNAEVLDNIIMSRPNTGKALQHGLEFTPLPSKAVTSLAKMEEAFMSRFIDKIPVIGSIVRASNRAYVSVLNDMRSRSWESTVTQWEKLGAKDIDYQGLAGFINAASGRGSLPKALRGASPLLNATLFSPKLLMSRIQLPTYLFSSSPLVRKEAAQTLVSFLGTGTGLLGLASMGGANIETDPRSSDFGKMRVGDTRIDIWSGYSQWARFIAQVSTGERKTVGGDVREVNRKEVVERFLQSKSSPALGLLVDILKGESYMGEEISLDTQDLREQAANRLLPLFVQDMMDAIYQQGLEGGLLALPAFLGVGVTTYLNPVQKMREELATKKYGMSWEEVGKTMGNVAQRQLENENPQLTQLAEQEQAQYSKSIAGKADPNNRYRIEVGLIEDSYAKNIERATQEFQDKGDGTAYREKINNIAMNRREQYNLVNMNPDYAQVVDYYKKPLDEKRMAKMNPQDIARHSYNDLLYGDDMYDQYGNYRFDMIDPMRTAFSQQYGLDMLAYVEEYQNIKAKDMPPEYDMLKQAQSILRPYFEIETQIWSQYPSDMEQAAKEIEIIGRTDKYKERQMLSKYPQIVYIRKMIAYEKLRLKMQNPQMAQALKMFYSY